MRILVTNDDGIDSIGSARAGTGDVPARRRPRGRGGRARRRVLGAGASLGALHLIRPEVRVARIEGCTASAVWAVTGPPASCVMFSRLGAFGEPFDLVVSGINPGANVGRAVYHSGTVGAALTARNGHISGVAISQSVAGFGVEGQAWDEAIIGQHWDIGRRDRTCDRAGPARRHAGRTRRRERQRPRRPAGGDHDVEVRHRGQPATAVDGGGDTRPGARPRRCVPREHGVGRHGRPSIPRPTAGSSSGARWR